MHCRGWLPFLGGIFTPIMQNDLILYNNHPEIPMHIKKLLNNQGRVFFEKSRIINQCFDALEVVYFVNAPASGGVFLFNQYRIIKLIIWDFSPEIKELGLRAMNIKLVKQAVHACLVFP